MSTSKYMDIYTDAAKTVPAQPLDMGAGRLDLTNAADPGVILDPPSLSFGAVTYGGTKTIEVKLTSVASAAETYALSTVNTEMGFGSLTTVDGMTVDPLSVTLAPGETKTIKVTWDTTKTSGEGDQPGLRAADWQHAQGAHAGLDACGLRAHADRARSQSAAAEQAWTTPWPPWAAAQPSSRWYWWTTTAAPAAGIAKVRFVHASPDAPAVDIAVKDGP